MIRTTVLHVVVKRIEEIEAVLGQERQNRKQTFLQVMLREHQTAEMGGAVGDLRTAPQRLAGRFAAVFLNLVEDLRTALLHGRAQGRIEVVQLGLQSVDGVPNLAGDVFERDLERFRDQARGNPFLQDVLSVETISEGDAVI